MKHLFILAGLFLSATAFSQTNTWTGATDTDWHKACNWSLNLIPTCSHDVVIPNVTNDPRITAIAHCKTIDVQSTSGALLEITNTGNLSVSSTNGGACSGTATDNLGCCTEWVQTNNLSNTITNVPNSEKEQAEAVAFDGTYLYITGDRHSGKGSINPLPNSDWRIEKRLASNGSLQSGFGSGGVVTVDIGWIDVPLGIVADGSGGIYVAGMQHGTGQYIDPQKWRVQKFNASSGASMWVQTPVFGSGTETAQDIAINSTGVYVSGYDVAPGNGQWRIVKYNTSGAQQWSVFNNHSTGFDVAYGIAADDTYVYAVGTAAPGSDARWVVERRFASNGALATGFGSGGVITDNPVVGSGVSDYAHDVAVDATSIYVVGLVNATYPNYQYALRKYNKSNGNLEWSTTSAPQGNIRDYRVAVDATGIYVSGNWAEWSLYKYDFSGNLVCSTSSTGNSPSTHGMIAVSAGVFMVGKDNTASNERWRMEKMCCP